MLQNEIYERARLARDARFDGQFYVGVRSTGIYCRPICPANAPKSENVTFFPSAAAAGEAARTALERYAKAIQLKPVEGWAA